MSYGLCRDDYFGILHHFHLALVCFVFFVFSGGWLSYYLCGEIKADSAWVLEKIRIASYLPVII